MEKSLLYKIVRPVGKLWYKMTYHPTIIGKENIPKEGSLLICGNHINAFDPLNPIISTKRVIHYMAKREYHDGKMGLFFDLVGTIPVDRSKKDPNAKSRAVEVLESGGAIGIFPEGTRNRTDQILLPFKYGAVSLASKTKSLIVPMAITGEYKWNNKNLLVRFGKPFYVSSSDLEKENEKLRNTILKLIEENKKYYKKNNIKY